MCSQHYSKDFHVVTNLMITTDVGTIPALISRGRNGSIQSLITCPMSHSQKVAEYIFLPTWASFGMCRLKDQTIV